MNYIIIDQGTSSTKAFLFNSKGEIIHNNTIKHEIINPKKFHFENDPIEILNAIKKLFQEMIDATYNVKIRHAGLSVQRSTFMFWNKYTLEPITPAISWQDSRAYKTIKKYEKYKKRLWEITGTPLSPHFGGPKFSYLTLHNIHLKTLIKKNQIFFGPLSSYLTHAMTGTAALDHTIACRTLLFNLKKNTWSKFALKLFKIPQTCLPPLKPAKNEYGKIFNSNILLSTVIGDQQAALIGQHGLIHNSLGANFGTSGSIQYNVGTKPLIKKGLISSILFSSDKKNVFMLEGTINSCNSLFYNLETLLCIDHKKMNWNERIKNIKTKGIMIPGASGLAAPYWTIGFNNIFIDLPYNKPNQIIRAGMESIGFLTNDILNCFKKNKIILPKKLTVSGGGARSSLLQFIANITGFEIYLSTIKDRTALGVFKILCPSIKKVRKNDQSFIPQKDSYGTIKLKNWKKAIKNNDIKKVYSDI